MNPNYAWLRQLIAFGILLAIWEAAGRAGMLPGMIITAVNDSSKAVSLDKTSGVHDRKSPPLMFALSDPRSRPRLARLRLRAEGSSRAPRRFRYQRSQSR